MRTTTLVLALSVAGLLLSGYLSYLHFVPAEQQNHFCDLSSTLSCSTVNSSSYAWFLGIPVAFIGFGGFVLLGFLATAPLRYKGPLLVMFSGIGVAFMLYLTATEILIIKAICILCVTVGLVSALILILSVTAFGMETIRFVKNIRIE